MKWLSGLLCAALAAQPSAENIAAFEKIWSTVRDRYWDVKKLENLGDGRSWQEVHDDFALRLQKTESDREARAVMTEMLALLGQSHFAILAGDVEDDLTPLHAGDGSPGIDLIWAEGKILVRGIRNAGGAARAGVQMGWEIVKIDQFDVRSAAKRVAARRVLRQREVLLRMLVMGHLSGAPGSAANVTFDDGTGQQVMRKILRDQPQGTRARFGFLPPMIVDFEARRPRPNTGYVRFNVFLDPSGLMSKFEDSVKSCLKCDGFIVDLRGNPGGLAILGASMAGFFINQQDTKLGTLYQRNLNLKLFVNPRLDNFRGPLAVLVDGASVSTSEIMAGGLQDLKRGRVFGTRTAGAALPSMVERLPNGDLFQYAMANYVSEGGRVLEGVGVMPDQPVVTTQAILLKGKDPVLEAALDWIHAQKR